MGGGVDLSKRRVELRKSTVNLFGVIVYKSI